MDATEIETGWSQEILRQVAIFSPFTFRKMAEIFRGDGRFVHYTSAEVAVSIIQNRAVWMRNAAVMNDFLEVEHGRACLHFALNDDPVGARFRTLCDQLRDGLFDELVERIDGWLPDMQTNTFLTCLSEHSSAEDDNGRLSMWRAYGGRSGIALVLNRTPFEAVTDVLQAYSSPVFYASREGFAEYLGEVCDNIELNIEYLTNLNADVLLGNLFNLCRSAVLCTKHPGFSEEREWRIIYAPNMGLSQAIESSVQVVRGVPQVVNKIPLRNSPEEGLYGAAIPDLLDRVIIGPTDDQLSVYQALVVLLREAGVENPAERIAVSGIPLRQS